MTWKPATYTMLDATTAALTCPYCHKDAGEFERGSTRMPDAQVCPECDQTFVIPVALSRGTFLPIETPKDVANPPAIRSEPSVNHYMLDIETMGSGKRAAIVQIGMVKFVPHGAPLPFEPQPDAPTSLFINVNLQSCIDAGMNVDGDTVMWWLGQSTEARKSLFTPAPVPLDHALQRMKKFIGDWKQDCVWSKGPGFDAAIISEAFRLTGQKFGLHSYVNERDVRTLVALAGFDEAAFAIETGERIAHNAFNDAWYQARMVQDCYLKLGKAERMI